MVLYFNDFALVRTSRDQLISSPPSRITISQHHKPEVFSTNNRSADQAFNFTNSEPSSEPKGKKELQNHVTVESSFHPQHDRVYNKRSEKRDIMVFFHMQKTGGNTFITHLLSTRTMQGVPMCDKMIIPLTYKLKPVHVCPLEKLKSINLLRPEMWLATEETYHWPCGIHPFLSEMRPCLNNYLIYMYGEKNRQFHYFTMLRNPVIRYVSEFKHVSRRTDEWLSRHVCNYDPIEISQCYEGYNARRKWIGVTLEKFMHCSSNLANNRQTIMLANLSSVDCLNPKSSMSSSERDTLLLESAKTNLKEMSFFGLTDYFLESCFLFEKQFNVKFGKPCIQKKKDDLYSSRTMKGILSDKTLQYSIELLNHLDMQLYDYALTLFITRLEEYNIEFSGKL